MDKEIQVNRLQRSMTVQIPAHLIPEFMSMVRKGTNCSPNMHPEIRRFTDKLFEREHLMNGNMLPQER